MWAVRKEGIKKDHQVLIPISLIYGVPFRIVSKPSRGKKNKFGHFLVVVQLIHRLMQADISCTTTARLFFCLLLGLHA